MNFAVLKIKLWFRQEGETRLLKFEEDKVNVITGDSSTGKSSILRIIDYCLLQDKCNIVQDVINQNVAWYGMVFKCEENIYTVIRKAPTLEQAEMEVVFRDGEYLPDKPQLEASDIRPVAMNRMNKIFHVDSRIVLPSKVRYNFRHNLVFNYLTEDIIATENTYQDLRFFRAAEYYQILNDLFKLAIGADEVKLQNLECSKRKEVTHYRRLLNTQRKNDEFTNNVQQEWKDIYVELESLGLDNELKNQSQSQVMGTLQNLLNKYRAQFLDDQNRERRELLNKQLQESKDALADYNVLESEYKTYMQRLARKNDSLAPLEYIQKHSNQLIRNYETRLLLDNLITAWDSIKKCYNPSMTLPENFSARKIELETQIRIIECELEKLNPLNANKKDVSWISRVVLLVHRIENLLASKQPKFINDTILTKLEERISVIDEQISRLKVRNENAIDELNKRINRYFHSQKGVSDSYSDCTTVYSMKEHSVMLDREDMEYPIANVGSKSNYMFLHLCYFYGLHDLLRANNNQQIGSFLFIDQPSIPYYASKATGSDEVQLTDDEAKLKSAFSLTDMFMKNMTQEDGHFQIIMVEHATPDYWGDLKTFRTVCEFRDGEGLIPNYIKYHKV